MKIFNIIFFLSNLIGNSNTILCCLFQISLICSLPGQDAQPIVHLNDNTYMYDHKYYPSFEQLDPVFKEDMDLYYRFKENLAIRASAEKWRTITIASGVMTGLSVLWHRQSVNSLNPNDLSTFITAPFGAGMAIVLGVMSGVTTLIGITQTTSNYSKSKVRNRELIDDFNNKIGTSYRPEQTEGYISLGLHSNGVGLIYSF